MNALESSSLAVPRGRARERLLFAAVVVLALVGLASQVSEVARLSSRALRHDLVAAARTALLRGGALHLPRNESLHLAALHQACTTRAFNDSIIPWTLGIDPLARPMSRTDPKVLDALRHCPDVDIFLPGGIRSHGYCEDGVAYTKYLESRLLPMWVMQQEFFDPASNKNVSYHDLCPHTPIIIFNHYFDGIHEDPRWPRTKPIYIMPNLEMHELEAKHYWLADVVLCKTEICDRYVKKWYRQEGNPRNATVLYTRHTSSDVAFGARVALGDDAIAAKNFAKPVFVHTAGTSIQKGTARVLDCWLKRPDLPPVDIYIGNGLYKGEFAKSYGKGIAKSANVRVHTGKLDATSFGKVIAEASFFLCTSIQEGYGHYINQARAAGGLVLTPNVPPMNELITENTGKLIRARARGSGDMFLSGESKHALGLRNVTGFIADFGGKQVCAAVDFVMANLTSWERRLRAEQGKQQYIADTIFFARAMQQLRFLARRQAAAVALVIQG